MRKVLKHMPNIQVILIKDVPNLGKIGEKKVVKPGYARNFLLKQNFAVLPTDPRARSIVKIEEEKSKEIKTKDKEIGEKFEDLKDKKISFTVKVNKKGKPFKAISPKDIAIKLNIPIKFVKSKSLEDLGEHQVVIQKGEIKTQVSVEVLAEKD